MLYWKRGLRSKTVSTVLSGGHYVRSLKGVLIVPEVTDSLMWSAFWLSTDYTSISFVQSVIQEVFQSDICVCPSVGITRIVFDSYRELIIEEGEWIRRAGEHSAVKLVVVEESVPIPHMVDKFAASSVNKQNLQLLAREEICRTWFWVGWLSTKSYYLQDWSWMDHVRVNCHFSTTGKRRQTVE